MSELPDWAEGLGFSRHPEGGWYTETWRSSVEILHPHLPGGYPSSRAAATAILFLLLPGEQSAWHTVRGTEIWLYHRGSPVLLELGGSGPGPGVITPLTVGPDVLAGQSPQRVVPPSTWQRARPLGDEAALVSCIVSPGFDFEDFALEKNG
ncbi:cupin domain-containing protein [Rhodococcoides yunnanense]|uniref:cupin domain-containing protein n=1 Tax=Rhodococcoides yunnanense TaxID=278209 RepID=UPI00093400C8|nr:cupin domain-containing protein [Rhodococcus yunnanensis]